MTITTKYNVGDVVYFYTNVNGFQKRVIKQIKIENKTSSEFDVFYITDMNSYPIKENELYEYPSDLYNALVKEITKEYETWLAEKENIE